MLEEEEKAMKEQKEASNGFKSKQPNPLQMNDVEDRDVKKENIKTKPKMTEKKQKTYETKDEQIVRGIKHMVPKTWKS